MPILSVIIPVFNEERFLDEALRSVASQTFSDIEIICVNDGSTDGSLVALERWASEDLRIKIINKQNGGYGSAMNVGLAVASGEYIGIVEPDDFIDERMFELLWNARGLDKGETEADVVKAGWFDYYPANDTEPELSIPTTLSQEYDCPKQGSISQLKEILRYHPSIWSCIYKRSFLQEQDIRFLEYPGASWADNPFFYETMLTAQSISWIPDNLYYYRHSETQSSALGSVSYDLPLDRIEDIIAIYEGRQITDRSFYEMLYIRIFNYTYSLMNAINWDASNASFWQRLKDIYGWMDADIVVKSDRFSLEKKRFFLEVRGERPFAQLKTEETQYETCVVIPIQNDCRYIYESLAGYCKRARHPVRIVCVNEGSFDLSREFVERIASMNDRVSWVDEVSGECHGHKVLRGDIRMLPPHNYDVNQSIEGGTSLVRTSAIPSFQTKRPDTNKPTKKKENRVFHGVKKRINAYRARH